MLLTILWKVHLQLYSYIVHIIIWLKTIIVSHILSCSYNYVDGTAVLMLVDALSLLGKVSFKQHRVKPQIYYTYSLPIHHQSIEFMLEHGVCSQIRNIHFYAHDPLPIPCKHRISECSVGLGCYNWLMVLMKNTQSIGISLYVHG